MKKTDIAKILGRLGGEARSKQLSVSQKKKIASLGGKAKADSFHAGKRISENFRYLKVINSLAGGVRKVKRVKNTKTRLPGIYD